MIVAHADPVMNKVTMLSIPRDLYWKGRKINSYFQLYGPDQFMAEFSELTGLTIDRYVSIDMFAFIDAINALGGITVTLDQTLIDPSYRTFENGVWSTLHYRAGTHRLDGIASLRIARSRNTTMDFDRSKRQQLIIQAASERLAEVAAKEPGRLYGLLEVLLKYVKTNLNPFELGQLAITYARADFDTGNVVDTNNVVYSTWSNVYFLPPEEQALALADPEFPLGLWILLPKDGDWTQVKAFIQKAIFSS